MSQEPLEPSAPEMEKKIENHEVPRIGKDEMNLVEYPFATLRNEAVPGTIIERQWETEHPITKKTVSATWRVTGDPELGLPTANDERVFLVLMELTREAGFAQEIYFTRYGLLQRLGWTPNDKSYARLTEAFRRLTAVTITSENAFWNPSAKVFHNRGFHILESYDIVAEKAGRKKAGADLPLSHFRWSRELADSFAAGYIRSIDLGIALTLDLPLSVRLFRYLDKKKHDGKAFFEIELQRLCEVHLGMAIAKHASTMKVRLSPAHEELVRRDIVQGVEYLPMKTKKAEKVRYLFLPPPKSAEEKQDEAAPDETPPPVSETPTLELLLETEPAKPQLTRDRVLQRMTRLGVSTTIARQLCEDKSLEELALQLDCLSDRKPKDAAATFVAAVRGGWAPPGVFVARRDSQAHEEALEAQRKTKAAQQREEKKRRAEIEAAEAQENAALDAKFEVLASWMREKIDGEVRGRMQFVLNHLGEEATRNGWAATRRQIMREWDETGQLDQSEPDEAEARRLQLRTVLSSDAEVEKFFAGLGVDEQGMIEAETQNRLEKTGMGHLGAQHAGRLGVRRTVTREWLMKQP